MPSHVLSQAVLPPSLWEIATNSGLILLLLKRMGVLPLTSRREDAGPLLANPVFRVLSRY